MKTRSLTLLVLAVLLSFVQSSVAQMTPPPFPYTEFPIGPFQIATFGPTLEQDDNTSDEYPSKVMKMMGEGGFNTLYHNIYSSGHFLMAAQMPKGMTSYTCWSGYPENDNIEWEHIGNRFIMPGFDREFFLSSEFNAFDEFKYDQQDRDHFWGLDQTTPPTLRTTTGGTEWQLPVQSGIVAQLLIDGEPGSPNDGRDADRSVIGKLSNGIFNILDGVWKISSDVVYRLDGDEIIAGTSGSLRSNPTAVICTLKVELLDASDVVVQTLSQEITWSNYDSYISGSHPFERKSTLNFGLQQYAVSRIDGGNSSNQYMPMTVIANNPVTCKYRVTVISTGLTSIYLKGVRLRSMRADKILTGQKDAEIKADFDAYLGDMWNVKYPETGPATYARDRISAMAGFGELQYEGMRTLAYVDNLFYNHTYQFRKVKRNLFTFMSGNGGKYGFYRAIYEDQNGVPPPVVMQESFAAFEKDNTFYPHSVMVVPPYMPQDGVPEDLRTATDFEDLGYEVKGYEDYTLSRQGYDEDVFGTIEDGASKFPGYYDRSATDHKGAAIAAYLAPSGMKGKWYSVLSTILNFRGVPDRGTGHSAKSNADIRTATLPTVIQNLKDIWNASPSTRPARNSATAFSRGLKWDEIWSDDGGLDQTEWDGGKLLSSSRGPFKEEARADAWCALSYGAKGLFFNPVGSDGGEQIGITDEFLRRDYDDPTSNLEGLIGLKGIGSECDPYFRDEDFTHRRIVYKGSGDIGAALQFQMIPREEAPGDLLEEDEIEDWLENNAFEWVQDDHTRASSSLLPCPSCWEASVDAGGTNNREVQQIQASPTVTGGTFTLSYNDGSVTRTTSNLDWDATASEIASALDALDNLAGSDIEVTCGPLPDHAINITFKNSLAGQEISDLIINSSLTGTGNFAVRERFPHYRWWSFFDVDYPDGLWWDGWPNYWRWSSVDLRGYIPTFYGFKERWIGSKQVVDDIKPIASILPKLEWQGTTINYARTSSNSDADWAKFPMQDVTTSSSSSPSVSQLINPTTLDGNNRLQPIASTFDSRKESYVQLGLFKNVDDDPDAYYVVVGNRRTWPLNYDRDGEGEITGINTDEERLGAVDARRFQFFIRTSGLFSATASPKYFSVKNLRTNTEQIGESDDMDLTTSGNDPYFVDLEPGEGTILRIAPARSFLVAKSSEGGMEYNNGHRIADLGEISDDETEPNTWTQRLMTWERDGSIQYAIVNNLGEVHETNFFDPADPVGAPQDPRNYDHHTLEFANNGLTFYNPSVAAKIGSGAETDLDTVAIAYSVDLFNDATDEYSREVRVQLGVREVTGTTSGIDWIGQKTLAMNMPWMEDEFPTPVVTPLQDGFFVAWAGHDEENDPAVMSSIVHVRDVSDNPTWVTLNNEPLRANPGAEKVLFPTVASRDEYSSSSEGRRKDRVHLAWEEWTSEIPEITSHIYYAWFDLKYPSSGGSVDEQVDIIAPEEIGGSSYERVSKGHNSCEHHHPNIAVKNYLFGVSTVLEASPIVVWEAVTCRGGDQGAVVLRSKIGVNDPQPCCPPALWGDFTEFYKKLKHKTPQPQVRVGVTGISVQPTPPTPPITESMAVIFHDANSKELVHERFVRGIDARWIRSTVFDKGQNPSVSLAFHPSFGQSNITTFAFRGSSADEDGLFDARITARTTGFSKDESTSLAHRINVSKSVACDKGVAFIAGDGSVGCATCPDYTGDTSVTDARTTIKWEMKDLSRDGFGEGEPRSSTSVPFAGGSAYPIPITEDSIRTNVFPVTSGDVLRYDRTAIINDTVWFASQFTDTNQYIRIDVLLKDSASHAVVDTIDFMVVKKHPNPIPPSIKVIGNFTETKTIQCPEYASVLKFRSSIVPPSIPPSGKGYLTIKVTKDTVSDFELSHSQIMNEGFDAILDEVEGSEQAALKTTTDRAFKRKEENIQLYAFPNPFSSITNVEFRGVADAQTSIEVFDVSGQRLMTLFEDYAPVDGMISLKFDRAGLADGTYYLRAVSGDAVASKRIIVIK